MRFAIAAVVFSLCLLPAQDKPKSALDKPTLEAYVRHLLAVIPEVQVKIDDPQPAPAGLERVEVHFTYGTRSQDETFYVSKDGKNIVRGTLYDITQNPFQEDLAKIKTDTSPNFGTAGAPVTLVMYGDFECPDCKMEAQTVRQNLAATFPTQVRVYFKDFPLESIHNWARPAALAGRCIFKQSPAKFWDYFDWVYDNQQLIGADNFASKLQTFASEKGLDGMQLGRCMESKTTEAELNREIEEGHALQVSATPTIFLNGRKLEGSVPWETMKQLIDLEAEHQAKARDASEKCCEVTLPKIGKQ